MAASVKNEILTEISTNSSFPRVLKALFGVGVCIAIPTAAYQLLVFWLKRRVARIREENAQFFQCQTGTKHDEGVSIESLHALCRSTHPNLRRCAQLLAIEKFLNNEKAVNLVFYHCLHGSKDDMNRACMIFCHTLLFIDSELETRPIAYRKAIVQTLAQMITASARPDFSKDIIFRRKIQKMSLYAANTVYTFANSAEIEAEDPIPEEIFSDLCRSLLYLLKTSNYRDIQRLCLTILSVLGGEGQRESVIVRADGIKILAETFKVFLGETVFQRICLQLINANIHSIHAETPRETLIKDLKIIRPLLACLKSEDHICVNLAAILLYHLVGPAGDTCLKEIKSVPSAIRILSRVLCNNDVKQRCLMLRIIFMLSVDDSDFKQQVLSCTELLEKLALLYLTNDTDVVSSALALTECLMLEGKDAITTMLSANPHLLRHLASVSSHQDGVIPRMVTEILCLCTNEDVVEKSVEYGVLPTIMHFIHGHTPDSDILTQLAAMLLNVALASDTMKTEIMKSGGLQILMSLVFSGSGSSSGPGRILASRTLIMLGSNDEICTVKMIHGESGSGTFEVQDQKVHFYNQGMHMMKFDISDWTLSHHTMTPDLIVSPEPGLLYIIICKAEIAKDENAYPDFFEFFDFGNFELKSDLFIAVGHSYENGRLKCELSGLDYDTHWTNTIHYHKLVDDLVRSKLCELTKRAILAIRSPISKVAELNISQGLVHDPAHAKAYLDIPGSVEYLLDMVSAVVDSIPQMHHLDPIIAMFAHGMAALEMIEVLVKHQHFYRVKSNLVEILVGLLQQMNRLSLNNTLKTLPTRQKQLYSDYQEIFTNLMKHAVYTMYQLLSQCDRENMRKKLVKNGGHFMIWSTLLSVQSALLNEIAIPSSSALAILFAPDFSLTAKPHKNVPCVLSTVDKTPALQVAPSLLEAKNGSWTFESVRGTLSTKDVMGSGDMKGWYYEATIESSGIIQLGWATQKCPFRAQKGLGVGDDVHSVAYDGDRCKKWNGPDSTKNGNNYGKLWKAGDTITCLLTTDGQTSYMLQGESLGVAYDNIPMDMAWYPAASLATDQQVNFNFGSSPYRYPVPGYMTMCHGINTKSLALTPPDDKKCQLKNLIILFREQSEYHVPMVYFEVNLQRRSPETIRIGMESVSQKLERIFCTYDGRYLSLPDGIAICDLFDTNEGIPITLGVGYLLHQASIFFVIDGTPLRETYKIEDGSKSPVVPYLSTPFVDVNFGAKYFVYDSANDNTLRLGCAALLIDYFDMSCEKTV